MSRTGRRVRYGVAMSLDGFIAGPNGEYDWIVEDKEADAYLVEVWGRFDTLLMGRKTWEVAKAMFTPKAVGHRVVAVASRTMQPEESPGVKVVRELDREAVQRLRMRESKAGHDGQDLWLMGGAELFRQVLLMGEVDGVDVSVVPVLLGGGVPLLPEIRQRTELVLTGHRVFPSGIVALSYDVKRNGS